MRFPIGGAVLKVALLVSVATACDVGRDEVPVGRAADPRPNVVLILVDDAGYADFGFSGDPEMPTPHIDSIAAAGVRFTQGYNAASVCSPSRAGLLTGRYPQRFGHEFNIPRQAQPGADLDDIGLPLAERTLADALRAEGYATAAVGKWHLGLAPAFHPLNRGFDRFFGFLYGSRSYFPLADASDRGLHLWRDLEPHPEQDGYLTDVLAERAAALIGELRERPFFLYVAFNAVHTPMHAKPEHEALFAGIDDERRRTLAAMTAALDDAVGRILETLRALQLEDDTLLFFVNDNGGATNNASSNAPLRGQKGDKFEGGIRVPFLAQWPGTLPRGSDYDYPISSMDIFPTAMAAAGAAAPGNLDGVSLIPFVTGELEGPPHRTLFWRRGALAAVRSVGEDGDFKLIRVDGSTTWMFDMAADPYETANLLQSGSAHENESRIRAYLEGALQDWEAETLPPLWRTDPIWTASQIEKHTIGTAQPPMVPLRPGYTPTAAGAPATDIYLADLTLADERYRVGSVRNITDREGYDNQPAFTADGSGLLYTSARNRWQTDIYRYDIERGTTRQVTQTVASEFSATPLPGGGFSAVNESVDGQVLWRYGDDGGSRGALLPDLQPVGYHAWGNDSLLIMFVLGNGAPATLQLGDLREGSTEVIAENPGRSLHKVPGRNAVSFVRKLSEDEWWLEILELDSREVVRWGRTLAGREDYAWTPRGSVIMGDGAKLFQRRSGGEWEQIADLGSTGVGDISRLAINGSGTLIAIVGNR